MVASEIDVLIFFEHVSRELDSCFFLKNELEKIGLKTKVLPIHRNRYFNVFRYRPKIIVVPFLFADDIDRLWKDFIRCYKDVLCFNLHHEQFYNEMTKSHFMPKNKLSKESYHLAWTEKFKNDLIECGVSEEKIFVFGNPRTDSYYLKPNQKVLKFKNESQKLIFIPTSFSWAFVDEKYFIENAKLDPDKFYPQRNLTVKTINIFFKSIRDIAEKNIDKIFILRPHPFEDITKYTDHLIKSKNAPIETNVKVVRDGTIYDWLNVSDLVIGWITTVNLEAELFNKKNLVFQPVPLPNNMQTEFNLLYDKIIQEKDELEEIVENLENYLPKNKELHNFAIKAFGLADGKVSERLAETIKSIIKENDSKKSNNIYLVKILFKSIFIDLPKNVFIKFNILHKYNEIYSGLIEDLPSSKYLEKIYCSFKLRL